MDPGSRHEEAGMNPTTTAVPAGETGARSALPIATPTPSRLLSLDVFRGITIAGMLLVNNPGSWATVYPPLRHAEWHGWTPTDLIFPFFLFIVGVAMTFSFGKQLEAGAERGGVFLKAAKRAALLVLLGLILHGFPSYDLSTIRIPGVLQRVGLAFLVAAPIVLWLGRRGQAVAAAALLLGYWAAMTLVPVPGHGAGVLEPGRDLGAYIDRAVFGTAHLWKQAETWDPEGLLSTLPAVGTVLLGVLAGHWVRAAGGAERKAIGLLAAGSAGVAAGWAWGLVFPINKPLWTSSYVVFTAGLACWTLAACYWLVDVKGYRRWSHPFFLFGVNAIAAFFLSSLFARILTLIQWTDAAERTVTLKGYLYQTLFASWAAPVNASLLFALAYVGFWLAVMALMHRHRVYVKV
jgi:predicted acyltransferase